MTVDREWIARLPKAELHVHLDGCLRPATMLELARETGVSLPADTADALSGAMLVRHAKNLEEYLGRYRHTLALMQSPAALQRVAYELLVDVAAEGVRYVEVRYCPALHTPAMTLTEALAAPIEGLRRASAEVECRWSIIVCGLRTLDPGVSDELVRVAVERRADGVVAFDLAGAESGHPARDHARAFEYALEHGLHRTCHAGEAAGPESVRQALFDCHAERIGHGTHLHRDPELEEYVQERRIPLEVCLTSNVHTRAVTGAESHPFRRYFDRGLVVTLNTDSRLMDGITLNDEYWLAHTALGLTRDDLRRVVLHGFQSAFLPDDEKADLVATMTAELSNDP